MQLASGGIAFHKVTPRRRPCASWPDLGDGHLTSDGTDHLLEVTSLLLFDEGPGIAMFTHVPVRPTRWTYLAGSTGASYEMTCSTEGRSIPREMRSEQTRRSISPLAERCENPLTIGRFEFGRVVFDNQRSTSAWDETALASDLFEDLDQLHQPCRRIHRLCEAECLADAAVVVLDVGPMKEVSR